MKSQLQLYEQEKKEKEEITFIINTVNDESLQEQNYPIGVRMGTFLFG